MSFVSRAAPPYIRNRPIVLARIADLPTGCLRPCTCCGTGRWHRQPIIGRHRDTVKNTEDDEREIKYIYLRRARAVGAATSSSPEPTVREELGNRNLLPVGPSSLILRNGRHAQHDELERRPLERHCSLRRGSAVLRVCILMGPSSHRLNRSAGLNPQRRRADHHRNEQVTAEQHKLNASSR